MLPEKYQWLGVEFEPEGDPFAAFQVGVLLEKEGNLEGAATAIDRAYGLDPTHEGIRALRQSVLDRLAVTEHGLTFRYVPAGMFLMGSLDGDPDEQPRRPVFLDAFWIADTPLTAPDHDRLRAALIPPPEDDWHYYFGDRIRGQYSTDTGRFDADGGWVEDTPPGPRPTVAVTWAEATTIAKRMSTPQVRYALVTEAQWEKAARGGLIEKRYPWGDEPPAPGQCDVGRFWQLSILPVKACPPNGYGLYAMSGGVWEWCADWYDALFYTEGPDENPAGPKKGRERSLRGGSWADSHEAATVSFRMAAVDEQQRRGRAITPDNPNIGFRLCRLRS